MMSRNYDKSPNAKNAAFNPPVKVPGVTPEDYRADIASANGSAEAQNAGKGYPDNGPPDYTLPGYPMKKGNPKKSASNKK